jgi:ankyrin repeat protein
MNIFDLIRDGNIKRLKRYLEKNCVSEAKDLHGYTPLHLAAMYGNLEIINLLIPFNPINVQNHLGYTPLHSAVTQCHLDVVELLMKEGADVSITSNDGWSCLHTASQLGYKDMVKLLIHHGADMNYRNLLGLCAIHLAVSRGHLPIVQYLVKYGVDLDQKPESFSPLHVSALVGRMECFEYLVEIGLNIDLQNGQGNTPLHLACFEGEFPIAKLLVENGADMTILNYDEECVLDIVKPPMDMFIRESYQLQVKRDRSCLEMFRIATYLAQIRLPIEIKSHILSVVALGLSKHEWLLLSKALLSPRIVHQLNEYRLSRDFLRECKNIYHNL